MPIRFRFDPELNILFTTAEGLVTLSDVQSHLAQEESEDLIAVRELFDAIAASTI